ncbi:MAG TPA: hypothetical protein VM620_11855 [Hyphomicrobium sp.]|nr:hypothetical protein [Hyphomicrobium sp.]
MKLLARDMGVNGFSQLIDEAKAVRRYLFGVQQPGFRADLKSQSGLSRLTVPPNPPTEPAAHFSLSRRDLQGSPQGSVRHHQVRAVGRTPRVVKIFKALSERLAAVRLGIIRQANFKNLGASK